MEETRRLNLRPLVAILAVTLVAAAIWAATALAAGGSSSGSSGSGSGSATTEGPAAAQIQEEERDAPAGRDCPEEDSGPGSGEEPSDSTSSDV